MTLTPALLTKEFPFTKGQDMLDDVADWLAYSDGMKKIMEIIEIARAVPVLGIVLAYFLENPRPP